MADDDSKDPDAREVLEHHGAVFVDRDCLFASTTDDVLLSGYVNCELIFPHFRPMNNLMGQLVGRFMDMGVQGFAAPATGDIAPLQYATFCANQRGRRTTAVWADKQSDGSYKIERNGFVQVVEGRRTVVFLDRISTGITAQKIVDEVRRCGGEVVGVGTIAGVSTLTAESLGVPELHALCNIDVEAHHLNNDLPEEWRLMPIAVDETLGHGAKFLAEHGTNWEGGYIKLLS